jgi:hypothetical protein
MNGGTTFIYTFCGHRLTTLNFKSRNGNLRTQAAATINQHVALLHFAGVKNNIVVPEGHRPC